MIHAGSVGVDLLEIARLERAIERRPRLARRLFTEAELDECARRARPATHLAARFCAKEAAIKALGMRKASLSEFEVIGGRDSAPAMRLKGAAALVADELGASIRISLTHDRSNAMAVALLVRQ